MTVVRLSSVSPAFVPVHELFKMCVWIFATSLHFISHVMLHVNFNCECSCLIFCTHHIPYFLCCSKVLDFYKCAIWDLGENLFLACGLVLMVIILAFL